MRWKVLLAILVLFCAYLVFGGLIFWAVEGTPHGSGDTQVLGDVIDDVQLFNVTKFLQDSHGRICLSSSEMLDLIVNLTSFHRGRSPSSTSQSIGHQRQPEWNLAGSIFFAMTVVTTIGYGSLVPGTSMGRAFCCVYALVGIPMCMVMLMSIGEKLHEATKRLDAWIPGKRQSRWARYARSVAVAFVGLVVFMLVPSAVFGWLQGWTFGTALYFCLITLTTIGFGDYVAGISYSGPLSPLYRLLVGIWIFFGLAWLAGIVQSIQENFQSVVQQVDSRPIFNTGINEKERDADHPALTSHEPEVSSDKRSETHAVRETNFDVL